MTCRRRQIFFLILPLVTCLFVYLVIMWSNSFLWNLSTSSESIGHTNVKAVQKSYLILIWNWPFDTRQNIDVDFCKENTGVSNCSIVDNRSRYHDADIVLFHNWELANTHTVPLPVHLPRPMKQKWVWLSHESPLYNGDVKPLNGYFNLTMSYRRDADIYAPYGHMVPRKEVSKEPLENFIPKNKTHLACWFVSKNQPEYERVRVYNELKTVIPIEVYGKVTGKRVEESQRLPTISRCYFYLAFENSVYKDYITEKFWYNSLVSGAVPVIVGASREDYEAVAPKDSFIHVNDFKSVKELGEFLKNLVEDKERYASYFKWRRKYNAELQYWLNQLCEVCPKMSSLPQYKVYKDLDAWQKVH